MTQNTFCEHIVRQKCQGKFLIFRILLISLYAALLILPSFAIILFAPPNLIVPFLLVIASVVFLIFKLTWKLTCLEYEYQIIDDTIIFSKIYNRSRRKCLIEMPIRAFTVLGKYTHEAEGYLSHLLVDKSYLLISSFTAESIYFGVFEADGRKCIVFFEPTESSEMKLRRFAASAIRAYEREIKNYS